jgi:hypothetical protein
MKPAVKLGSYGLVLGVALAGGAGLGATLGIGPSVPPMGVHGGHAASLDASVEMPAGLSIADQGYRLEAERTVLPVGQSEFRFRISGPTGVVRSFEEGHGKELHFIAVSRDLHRYRHLHPVRDEDGTWFVGLSDLTPGAYRFFADFQPTGGPALTLGVDATVPGDYQAPQRPAATVSDQVGAFSVSLAGDIVTAGESRVTIRVRQDGVAAALEPYLGANGHLVAIREGDLAYLHVHPEDSRALVGEVPFALHAPSAGRYRLFFDFQVDGVVHTANFTVDVAADVGAGAGTAHAVEPGAH